MDTVRRNILATGAAATAVAVAPHAFAQQGAAMSFYEKGPVRICYEETGSGFPLLVIAGGGLNSTIAGLRGASSPFNTVKSGVEASPIRAFKCADPAVHDPISPLTWPRSPWPSR